MALFTKAFPKVHDWYLGRAVLGTVAELGPRERGGNVLIRETLQKPAAWFWVDRAVACRMQCHWPSATAVACRQERQCRSGTASPWQTAQ